MQRVKIENMSSFAAEEAAHTLAKTLAAAAEHQCRATKPGTTLRSGNITGELAITPRDVVRERINQSASSSRVKNCSRGVFLAGSITPRALQQDRAGLLKIGSGLENRRLGLGDMCDP